MRNTAITQVSIKDESGKHIYELSSKSCRFGSCAAFFCISAPSDISISVVSSDIDSGISIIRQGIYTSAVKHSKIKTACYAIDMSSTLDWRDKVSIDDLGSTAGCRVDAGCHDIRPQLTSRM